MDSIKKITIEASTELKSVMTAVDRIKFAIRLANANLDMLRPGDWINLKDDLCDYLAYGEGRGYTLRDMGGIGANVIPGTPLPTEYGEREFRSLQAELRGILGGATGTESSPIIRFPNMGLSLMPLRFLGLDHSFISGLGSTRDTFLIVLFLLLAKQGVGNIAKCPQCGETFWRGILRQKYCSRRCASSASVRAFYARGKGAAEKRKAKAETPRRKPKKQTEGKGVQGEHF